MSNPAAIDPLHDIDPDYGLMLGAAESLIPLFKVGLVNTTLARKMAIAAIDAYTPEGRADYVNAARTIAFSMAALALLGEAAATPDMKLPEKLRVFGKANALNRSADQSERMMMQRRRYHNTASHAEPPSPTTQGLDPSFADMQRQTDAIQEAVRIFNASSAAARTEADPPPAADPQPDPDPQPVAAPRPHRANAPAISARLQPAQPELPGHAGPSPHQTPPYIAAHLGSGPKPLVGSPQGR